MDHLETAKLLDAQRAQIADATVAELLQQPFWSARFGPGIGERMVLDVDANLAALVKSIRYRSPMIFEDHLTWRRSQIIGFGCSTGHLREVFAYAWMGMARGLPEAAQPLVYEYLQQGLQALRYNNASAQALAAAQAALAEELTAATSDTKWHGQAAYGPQGRDQVLYDAWFVVDALTDTLGGAGQDVLARWMRWRRDQLASLGLSTMHVQQQLWLLTEAVERQLTPPVASDTRRVLEAASAALVHDREACRALLGAQDTIVLDVAQGLYAAGLMPSGEQAAIEVGWYLAYITDAVAASDPAGLLSYTQWMHHWFASQGLPDTPLRQSYAALDQALERYLPHYAADEARAMLAATQRVLR